MVPLLGEIIIKQWLFGILLFLTSLFLILLVLVQRGRGGGLSGALGGMGGQSAFGAKAGDVFTRITIGAAIFWMLLCLAAVMFLPTKSALGPSDEPTATGTDKPGAGTTKTPAKTGDKPSTKPADKKQESED
jgi:preprotein translocase subunit SecG